MLVTAPTGTVLRSVTSGSTINLATLPTRSLSVSIIPATSIGSMRIQHNGDDRVENFAPYSLGGDTDGAFAPANFSLGTHTVTVTAYANPNLNGALRGSMTISYQVVDRRSSKTPILLTEENSDRAVAFNGATFIRGPFSLSTEQNFSSDKRTRVILFVTDFEFFDGDPLSDVVVEAQNSVVGNVSLPIESVRNIPAFDWLTQIEVILPDGLANAGDVWVHVGLRGVSSNEARLNIQQGAGATNLSTPMNLFREWWLTPDPRLFWPISLLRQQG